MRPGSWQQACAVGSWPWCSMAAYGSSRAVAGQPGYITDWDEGLASRNGRVHAAAPAHAHAWCCGSTLQQQLPQAWMRACMQAASSCGAEQVKWRQRSAGWRPRIMSQPVRLLEQHALLDKGACRLRRSTGGTGTCIRHARMVTHMDESTFAGISGCPGAVQPRMGRPPAGSPSRRIFSACMTPQKHPPQLQEAFKASSPDAAPPAHPLQAGRQAGMEHRALPPSLSELSPRMGKGPALPPSGKAACMQCSELIQGRLRPHPFIHPCVLPLSFLARRSGPHMQRQQHAAVALTAAALALNQGSSLKHHCATSHAPRTAPQVPHM